MFSVLATFYVAEFVKLFNNLQHSMPDPLWVGFLVSDKGGIWSAKRNLASSAAKWTVWSGKQKLWTF